MTMPELTEIKIMSDFINLKSTNKFKQAYHVAKGNIPTLFDKSELEHGFILTSESRGKELLLKTYNRIGQENIIHIFMGMSGNWKYVPTEKWNETKYTRLRLDDETGNSLLLYGGFMGPKYSVGKPFTGTKRGPDPTKEYDKFKENILTNLEKKSFDKPICEVLLNQEYFNGIGAYLNAEIIGRLDFNPFIKFKDLNNEDLEKLFIMIKKCCLESYELGGAELKDWHNPFGSSEIHKWILFYNNTNICRKQKFGTRNIWIQKKFI
jgi:endonuclease VIII-like 1